MGSYKLFKSEGNIIRGMLHGIHTKSEAEEVIREINVIFNEVQNPRVLIDMSKLKRATLGARKAHLVNMKNKPLKFEKLALYGASDMNRVMANLFIKASGLSDGIKYFKSEDDALIWLNK